MDSLLYLLYIITFIVSLLLIISGLMLVLKKFIHPGYDMYEAKIVENSCKIGHTGCDCGHDKPKQYKGLNCVSIVYTDSASGTKTIPDVTVSNKYTKDSPIKILVDSNANPVIAENIQIYNEDSFINGLILLGVGLLFMWFALYGMQKKKNYNKNKYYKDNMYVTW